MIKNPGDSKVLFHTQVAGPRKQAKGMATTIKMFHNKEMKDLIGGHKMPLVQGWLRAEHLWARMFAEYSLNKR